MRILITGVGDAFTRKHFGSSAVIEAPRGYVMIDCPDLVHRALAEAAARAGWPIDVSSISDILLTHLHGDHCNGVESLGFARRYAGPGGHVARPRLHTSRAAAGRVWERLAPAMDGAGRCDPLRTIDDFYELHVLEPEATAEIAGLSVRVRFTGHPIPTIGLLISDGNRTLGWSGDTPFEAAHIQWLSEADVIVHESNVGDAHTPIEALNELPDALRGKFRLIHLPDDFDAAGTDIEVLTEGAVIDLSARDVLSSP